MKTGKKIAVLALIFVAAAIIYFVWPLGRKEENKTGVVYTAMGEAELPVVYPTALGRELAPLFGHREELAVTAERDSLLVLPEAVSYTHLPCLRGPGGHDQEPGQHLRGGREAALY